MTSSDPTAGFGLRPYDVIALIDQERCTCHVAYGDTDSPEADYSDDCPQHGSATHDRRAAQVGPDEDVPF
jgi:hypothetical protein